MSIIFLDLVSGAKIFGNLGNSDKQAGNGIMPLMKGFPSKHRVKEEKGAIKNSGACLSIKKICTKKRASNIIWYGGDTFISVKL